MLARLLRAVHRGLAVTVFLVVMVPVCGLIILGPTLAIRRAVGRAGIRLGLLAIGCPIRVRGLEHLPPGPAIAVCNHQSYLDGLVLTAALPARFSFLVQDGAAGWPLVGLTLRRMGVRFVNRAAPRQAAAAMKDVLRRVTAGASFAIFPEGTFKLPPGLLPFRNGAFLIAARAGVPVAPVTVSGTRTVLPAGRKGMTPARIEVQVLPALRPTGASATAAAQLRDAVRAVILTHCGEPDALDGEDGDASASTTGEGDAAAIDADVIAAADPAHATAALEADAELEPARAPLDPDAFPKDR